MHLLARRAHQRCVLTAGVYNVPMPEFVSCSSCGFRMQMLLARPGQRIRCANCGRSFEPNVPTEPPPTELLPPMEALPSDEPERRAPRPRDDWRPPHRDDMPWRPPKLESPIHLRSIAEE